MAKFVFKMQNILKLKEKLEAQQKIAFRNASAVLYDEQEKLKGLLIRQAEYENRLREDTLENIDIAKIRFNKKAIDIMKTKVREQMFNIKKAEEALETERVKLDEAIKERKIQYKLRERALVEFKREIAKEESKEIDELVSFNYKARS